MEHARVLGITACLAFVGTAIASAQPPAIGDHYLSYAEFNIHPGPSVFASDQFIPDGLQVDLLELERFLNPVTQFDEPPQDPELHYTWWRIEPPQPVNRVVVVTNKFGESTWQILRLSFLLAPGGKQTPGPLPESNHYLCYEATGPAPNTPVVLTDQFRPPFTTLVGEPRFFCNPCLKNHAGAIFPIVDPELHLAVYEVQPPPFIITTVGFDQFGMHELLLDTPVPPEYLFVPSLKDVTVAVEPQTWGHIKSIFGGAGDEGR